MARCGDALRIALRSGPLRRHKRPRVGPWHTVALLHSRKAKGQGCPLWASAPRG